MAAAHQHKLNGWIEVLHRTAKNDPKGYEDLQREDYAPATATPMPLSEYDLVTEVLEHFLNPQTEAGEGLEIRGLREFDCITQFITTAPRRSSTHVLVTAKNAGKFFAQGAQVFGADFTEFKLISLPAASRFAPFFRNNK